VASSAFYPSPIIGVSESISWVRNMAPKDAVIMKQQLPTKSLAVQTLIFSIAGLRLQIVTIISLKPPPKIGASASHFLGINIGAKIKHSMYEEFVGFL
jgi:uncharacterized membrane protein AbrB (regulator of aidB expression)